MRKILIPLAFVVVAATSCQWPAPTVPREVVRFVHYERRVVEPTTTEPETFVSFEIEVESIVVTPEAPAEVEP